MLARAALFLLLWDAFLFFVIAENAQSVGFCAIVPDEFQGPAPPESIVVDYDSVKPKSCLGYSYRLSLASRDAQIVNHDRRIRFFAGPENVGRQIDDSLIFTNRFEDVRRNKCPVTYFSDNGRRSSVVFESISQAQCGNRCIFHVLRNGRDRCLADQGGNVLAFDTNEEVGSVSIDDRLSVDFGGLSRFLGRVSGN